MLEFTFKNKEDMENKIKNGDIQNSIYSYLEDITYSHIYHSSMCDSKLSEDTVCEYFCGYFCGEYIDDISNSNNEMAKLLQEIIVCVYKRFASEMDIVTRRNHFIHHTITFQEELKNIRKDLTEEDKDRIIEIALHYHEKIKDTQF